MTAPTTGPAAGPVSGPVSVALADLVIERELGDGGQGRVSQVRVPGTFPEPMAYKEYKPAVLGDLDLAALAAFVALPSTVGPDVAHTLRERTAWPVATVHRDGAVCGILMRLAPEDCVAYLRLGGAYTSQLLAMEFLLNPPEYMARVDLPVTERTRLTLLSDLAGLLQDLHRAGVVLGDLSPKNVLVSLRPPRCFVLDCDAARVHGRSMLPQVETPDWRVPTGDELATTASDRYKLALLAVRLLEADQSAAEPAALRPRFPELADLATLGMAAAANRPGPGDWADAIDRALPGAATTVPVAPAAAPAPAPTGFGRPSRAPVAPAAAPGPGAATGGGVSAGKVLAGVGLLVILGCLLMVILQLNGRDGSDSSSSDTADTVQYTPNGAGGAGGGGGGGGGRTPSRGTPVRTTEPAPAPTQIGIVALDPSTDPTDPTTADVAQMFDTYFRGINNRNWDTVLALYDPSGVVNPTVAKQRQAFIDALATTTDSDVRLRSVDTTAGTVTARVTFQSEQNAGLGPKDRPEETCTRWDVTYTLSSSGGGYRILRSVKGANQNSPC